MSSAYAMDDTEIIFEENIDDMYYADQDIDVWCSHMFHQTRESESEQELEDVTYHSLYHACQPNDVVPEDILPGKHVEIIEDEIIFTADAKGKITPMATGIMVVKDIQGRACSRLLRVLFDSGGSKSMLHRRILPRGATIDQTQGKQLMQTLAGNMAALGTVHMRGMRLPAFDKNRIIEEHEFHVFGEEEIFSRRLV